MEALELAPALHTEPVSQLMGAPTVCLSSREGGRSTGGPPACSGEWTESWTGCCVMQSSTHRRPRCRGHRGWAPIAEHPACGGWRLMQSWMGCCQMWSRWPSRPLCRLHRGGLPAAGPSVCSGGMRMQSWRGCCRACRRQRQLQQPTWPPSLRSLPPTLRAAAARVPFCRSRTLRLAALLATGPPAGGSPCSSREWRDRHAIAQAQPAASCPGMQ